MSCPMFVYKLQLFFTPVRTIAQLNPKPNYYGFSESLIHTGKFIFTNQNVISKSRIKQNSSITR